MHLNLEGVPGVGGWVGVGVCDCMSGSRCLGGHALFCEQPKAAEQAGLTRMIRAQKTRGKTSRCEEKEARRPKEKTLNGARPAWARRRRIQNTEYRTQTT